MIRHSFRVLPRQNVRLLVVIAVLAAALTVCAGPAFAGTDDYPYKNPSLYPSSSADPWGYYYRQCTSFVAWRLHSRNGFEMPRAIGDASQWAGWATGKYPVDNSPAVGAIAWFSYGHVAWVEAVANGSVTIEEYNVTPYTYGERTIPASSVSKFIHFKDLNGGGSSLTGGDGVQGEAQFAAISGGTLWHTMRRPDGSWQPKGNLSAALGLSNVTGVAWAGDGVQGEAQFAVISGGTLWHTIRRPDGSWQPKGNLSAALGLTNVVAIAAADDGIRGETQFAVVTADGSVWHTIRFPNGSWQAKGNLGSALALGKVASVAAASDGVSGEAQFVARATDGTLWHTIRRSNGTWQAKGNLSTALGLGAAKAVAAAADGVSGEAQFAIIDSNARLRHTIRRPNGSWQTPGDLTAALGLGPCTTIAATGDCVAGEAQFIMRTLDALANSRLKHTIRRPNGTWQPAGDLTTTLGL